MNIRMDDRVALITGVSRQVGIGAAIARRLAEAGAKLFITYYRPYDASMPWGSEPTEAHEIVSELNRITQAEAMEVDLGTQGAGESVMQAAVSRFGHVDVLVNNATQDYGAKLEEIDEATLNSHFAVNVRGPLMLMKEFVAQHDGREGGRIVNLTSGQSVNRMPESIPYIATKGAIEGLTLSLGAAAAAKGICVNGVDPGATDTGWMTPDVESQLAAMTDLGRVGQPDDVARLICFLASDAGRWITGQVVRSRGGLREG